MKLIAINYHYIRNSFDSPYPGIHGITPLQFERQLVQLEQIGEFISAKQLLEAVDSDKRLPEKSFVITFDDGLREQYDNALPVLQKLRVPAVFFINTAPIADQTVSMVHKIHILRSSVDPNEFIDMLNSNSDRLGIRIDDSVTAKEATNHYKYDSIEHAKVKYLLNFKMSSEERDILINECFRDRFAGEETAISKNLYMDVDQVRELGELDYIGTHTHEHVPVGMLDSSGIRREISESMRLIMSWCGRKPFALSYPYGSIEASSKTAARIAHEEGIKFAFTMERAANYDLSNPMHLARFDNNDMPLGKSSRWNPEELFDEVDPAAWIRKGLI